MRVPNWSRRYTNSGASVSSPPSSTRKITNTSTVRSGSSRTGLSSTEDELPGFISALKPRKSSRNSVMPVPGAFSRAIKASDSRFCPTAGPCSERINWPSSGKRVDMNAIPQENTNSAANSAQVIQNAVRNPCFSLLRCSCQPRPNRIGTSSGPNMIQKCLPSVKNARLGKIPPAWEEKLR